jgi:hypothetical protein
VSRPSRDDPSRRYFKASFLANSSRQTLRIEKAFGVNMDMLLRMQAWFDSYTMRQRAGEIDVKPFTPPGPR